MAIKACVNPLGIVAVKGVTAIELKVAAETVKVALPDFPPKVAEIFAEPTATPVAIPDDKIVTFVVLFDAHVTLLLISRLVPSE